MKNVVIKGKSTQYVVMTVCASHFIKCFVGLWGNSISHTRRNSVYMGWYQYRVERAMFKGKTCYKFSTFNLKHQNKTREEMCVRETEGGTKFG
jgi:hypothetical protein